MLQNKILIQICFSEGKFGKRNGAIHVREEGIYTRAKQAVPKAKHERDTQIINVLSGLALSHTSILSDMPESVAKSQAVFTRSKTVMISGK
jgi:hypothetical protein